MTVDELIVVTRIALGEAGLDSCYAAEVTLDDQVTVDDVIYGITYALTGCEFEGPGCRASLTPYALSQLEIGIFGSVSLKPGSDLQMSAFVLECCYFPRDVGACVEWSVEPAIGAAIDANGHENTAAMVRPTSLASRRPSVLASSRAQKARSSRLSSSIVGFGVKSGLGSSVSGAGLDLCSTMLVSL